MDPNILHNISYGMYILASNKADLLNAQVVNTVFQITSNPVIIAVSINKGNLTYEFIKASSHFSISVLSEDTPLSFIGKFGFKSGRQVNKFKDVKFKMLDSGCPVVLDNAICYIEAKVINEIDSGTHTLFLGQLSESQMLKLAKPMTYDYYHMEKRGTTPMSAPTFIREEMPVTKSIPMQRYRCVVCNYIYDPSVGDLEREIQPGTPFENLPPDWVCPICGADKSQFVPNDVTS